MTDLDPEVVLEAFRTAAVIHVGDPDDRARAYNDGFDEGYQQGLDAARTPRETPDPLRWWVQGALERLDTVIESMRATGPEPNALTDVAGWLRDGLAGKPVGLTATTARDLGPNRPPKPPDPPKDREMA